MIPANFAYDRAASLDEALALLESSDGAARPLAGGQSLIGLMRLRLARPERLVDIGRLRELQGIRTGPEGALIIGAAVTYRELLESEAAAAWPILAEATHEIGDLQVRNRGTIGGAVAHADPASDLPAVLLALDASFAVRSRAGERVLPADGFFQGAFETAMEPTEILTEIRIPALPTRAGTAYRMLTQMASGYALVGAAAVVARQDGTINHIRVGVTGVADAPYRATSVEDALMGKDPMPQDIATAAESAAQDRVVNSDIHADAEYRGAMASVQVRRAIEAALGRAS